MTDNKQVFESGNNNLNEDLRVTETPVEETNVVRTGEVEEAQTDLVKEDVTVDKDYEGVPMSNGENCGIVEFEGQRINTCDGEQIVDSGYTNPDL